MNFADLREKSSQQHTRDQESNQPTGHRLHWVFVPRNNLLVQIIFMCPTSLKGVCWFCWGVWDELFIQYILGKQPKWAEIDPAKNKVIQEQKYDHYMLCSTVNIYTATIIDTLFNQNHSITTLERRGKGNIYDEGKYREEA